MKEAYTKLSGACNTKIVAFVEEETARAAELQKELKAAEEEHKVRVETIKKQHALHMADAAKRREANAEKLTKTQGGIRGAEHLHGTSHRQGNRNWRNHHRHKDNNTTAIEHEGSSLHESRDPYISLRKSTNL